MANKEQPMMILKKIFSAGIISGLLFLSPNYSGFSQGKNKTEFNLTLRDGSIVTGTSTITKVDLSTAFGKLEIPIKNVTSIEVGINSDPQIKDKIFKLIQQLSNTNEQMRSSAHAELSDMGIEAIPVLNEFIYSEKYDAASYAENSPENILNGLTSKYGVGSDISEKDIVSIDFQFSMGGNFPFDKIDLKTEYGNLSIPKNKIKSIEIIYTEEGTATERAFKLMASKHISGNTNGGWLNTGLSIKSGQKMNITATGEVTLASLSGQKYKPGGTVANTGMNDVYDDASYGNYNYPTYGNLVYKIGESGTMMKAGDKFNGTANATGVLFLSIYETVFNAANTGAFNVKVSLK